MTLVTLQQLLSRFLSSSSLSSVTTESSFLVCPSRPLQSHVSTILRLLSLSLSSPLALLVPLSLTSLGGIIGAFKPASMNCLSDQFRRILSLVLPFALSTVLSVRTRSTRSSVTTICGSGRARAVGPSSSILILRMFPKNTCSSLTLFPLFSTRLSGHRRTDFPFICSSLKKDSDNAKSFVLLLCKVITRAFAQLSIYFNASRSRPLLDYGSAAIRLTEFLAFL
jgi:hypothetical protein